MPRVLAIVLAGGAGGRLRPLTEFRAKPAVRFGGTYRLLDFALTNCRAAGFADVWVAEQYLPQSIHDAVGNGRPWDLDRTFGGLRFLPPFGGDAGEGLADGNADALRRNLDHLRDFDPDVIVTMSADHVVRLDLARLVAVHAEKGAEVTMATTRLPEGHDLTRYALVGTKNGRVARFEYKPDEPKDDEIAIEAFAYDAAILYRGLEESDGEDYGHGLLPWFVARGKARAMAHEGYWRDVGTLSAYLRAHLDVVADPSLLCDDADPVISLADPLPPARVREGGKAVDSLLSPGSVVEGHVKRSVLAPGARVEAGAFVEESVILDGAVVRAGARLRRAIVDAGATAADRLSGTLEEPAVVGPGPRPKTRASDRPRV